MPERKIIDPASMVKATGGRQLVIDAVSGAIHVDGKFVGRVGSLDVEHHHYLRIARPDEHEVRLTAVFFDEPDYVPYADPVAAADELFSVVERILNENDSVRPGGLAGKLPTDWRIPLVKTANHYAEVRQHA